MSVACACIFLDMTGHSRNTETNKIERKNWFWLPSAISTFDQAHRSDWLFLFTLNPWSSLSLSLDHPHQFHVLVLKNCSVPVLCPCFLVFCHFSFLRGSFTAILNFCSCNFITRAPYASSGRGKAYMGLKVVSQVM